MKNKSNLSTVLVLGVLYLSACAPKNFEAVQQVATDTTKAIGCNDFESKTWDAINGYLIEQKSMLSLEELKNPLRSSLKTVKAPSGNLNERKVEALAQDMNELYNILLNEVPQVEEVQDAQGLLEVLSALELGDHTTDAKVRLQNKIEAQFAKIKKQIAAMDVQCATPVAPVPEEGEGAATPEFVKTSLPRPVFGIRFTFATAYQSCQVLDEPIMTKNTQDIDDRAITITGKHPNGVGNRREISNVTALLHSHPYYKNINSYANGCLKASTYPMIYDYGGKPYATTSANSVLNFFRDGGNGTKVLGTDCSGFVYSGLAAAGLRLSPNKVVKATGVNGISATMYMDPPRNGLNCLAKITVTPKSDLKAGDIVAVHGHVIMIDSVGSDPFGINGVKNADACSRLEPKDFDFVVIQSSPSKNAVGMNRYQAKDYLYESDKMRTGLTQYAYYACLARLNNRNYTPNLGTLSVIRHRQTPECLGARIKLSQESCIQSCPQLK
ncbi:MAG TPA: hypothetical protein VIG33_13855 [Pseudobdellovibrionaceae bacterium]